VHFQPLFIRRIWSPLALVLLLLGFVTLAEVIAEPVLRRVVTEALIYVVLVVGLYIFVGNSGVLSFGHVSFMLIGAYASAWQTCCHSLKPTFMPGLPQFLMDADVAVFPAALGAGLLASAFALVIGLPLMRMSGISASIALFGVLAVEIGVRKLEFLDGRHRVDHWTPYVHQCLCRTCVGDYNDIRGIFISGIEVWLDAPRIAGGCRLGASVRHKRVCRAANGAGDQRFFCVNCRRPIRSLSRNNLGRHLLAGYDVHHSRDARGGWFTQFGWCRHRRAFNNGLD
jgi:hypothetical protein